MVVYLQTIGELDSVVAQMSVTRTGRNKCEVIECSIFGDNHTIESKSLDDESVDQYIKRISDVCVLQPSSLYNFMSFYSKCQMSINDKFNKIYKDGERQNEAHSRLGEE